MIYVALEVKKKDGENTRSLLRRFSRRVQQSGVLLRARKNRFFEKERSKKEKKEGAVRRSRIRQEKDKLRKLGLLNEEDSYKKRR